MPRPSRAASSLRERPSFLDWGCEYPQIPVKLGAGMSLRVLILALAGVLVCFRTLASASPPDPTWIGGFWEDDDYDDTVFQTTSFSAAENALICALRPLWTAVWIVPAHHEELVPSPAVPPHQPRGPPLA